MTNIGIDLQVMFGESGEMREVFRQVIMMDGDERRVKSIVCALRQVIDSVMSTYLRDKAWRYELNLSDELREVTQCRT